MTRFPLGSLRARQAHLKAVGLLIAVLGGPLEAQQGTITGRVVDAETRAPLTSAVVTATPAAVTGGEAQALTDAQGRFTLLVDPGRYSVVVPYVGHRSLSLAVSLGEGSVETLELALVPLPMALDPVSVTAGRLQSPRSSLTVPAAVSVVTDEEIAVRSSATYVDYLKEMPGVEVMQVGIMTSRVTLRGENHIAGIADYRLLTDDRYANVPAQGNYFWAIAVPPLDVDRVEVALGPASALYGPGASKGVIQIITKSPIDEPGTGVSLTGGNRRMFGGAFRQAFRFNDKVGLKLTGQYLRAQEFEYRDPAEVRTTTNLLVGDRESIAARYGGEVRLDVRPWAGSDDAVKLTYGLNVVGSAIDMVGAEAFQVKNHRYQYLQARFNRSGFFAQTFFNMGHEGDSYTLRYGVPFIERSRVFGAQAQYASSPLPELELVGGVDFTQTIPRTGGTLHGEFEERDNIAEIGGYLSATHHVTDRIDLVGALRADHHQHLSPEIIWSPRVGVTVEPVENQVFRATYSRAYTPPLADLLFLDFERGQPYASPSYASSRIPAWAADNIYARDLGSAARFTWDDRCAGGVDDRCMRSPAMPGSQLPATGTAVWDSHIVPSLLSDPALVSTLASLGLTPGDFTAIVADPTSTDMASALRWGELPSEPDYAFEPVGHSEPDRASSYEIGYEGLIAERVRVSAAVYRAARWGIYGYGVVTPTVFLEPSSVESFIASRLVADGVSQSDADALAASVATTVGGWPLGTVAPDQRTEAEVIYTDIPLGLVDRHYWGLDMGLEAYVAPSVALTGSYSWLSKECFDADCAASLNSPSHRGSVGLRFDDPASGRVLGLRARYVDEFEQRSGVFNGTIESYTILDANLGYRFPGFDGLIASVTVNNVFDTRHREAIGAPELGRILMIQLQHTF